MRKVRSAVRVLIVALVLAGCSDTEPPGPEPGTYRIGVLEPASLLPAQVTDEPGRMITGALWTPLTSHDPETHEVTPLAAASISSPDQLVWTITLRPGQRFHDGSAVTARSYTGAWQAAMAQRWAGATVLTQVLRAKDMRAVSDTAVELVLDRPFAQVPLVLSAPALYPLPDSVLASKDWSGFARQPVGTGPYRMAELWQPGSGARLVRFDGYQGDAGIAREIAVKVVDDPAVLYNQVRTGALDIATTVPGASHDGMLAEFGGRHLQWPLPDLTYLALPLWDKRFQDPTVRHAFSLTVDRAALEAGPLDRQVDPARSLLPPSVALAPRQGPCRPCNHDPGAAKSLLGQIDPIQGPVHLYHEPGQEPWVGALVEQLRHTLQLDVIAMPLPSGPARDRPDGPFIVSRHLFTASPREPMTNLTGYTHAGFADLLATADAATDPAESAQLYRVAENQLLRDLPVIPLWSGHGHAVWSERVSIARSDPGRDINLAAVHVS